MLELVKEILAYFGGIVAISCATLIFCKNILEKYIYTRIEKTAEKELERAKSNFSRSFTAYEILLKKEFEYYESIDKIYADVIVDVQDVVFYSIEANNIDKQTKCEHIKDISLRLLQAIKDLKNLNLIYQVYVPVEIFSITGKVVVSIQDNCELIAQTAVNVFGGTDCDEKKIRAFNKQTLNTICMSNAFIRNRLETMSE